MLVAAALIDSMILLIEQLLNGAQFGVMLFLMAAGLTSDLWDHEPDQPGARFAVHGGGVCGGNGVWRDTLIPSGTRSRSRGRDRRGYRDRAGRVPSPLSAQPPRPGAGDLWADPVLQRNGADHLGRDRAVYAGAPTAVRPGDAAAGRALPGLPLGHHRGGAAGCAAAVAAGVAHPHRHADPRGAPTARCWERSGST